MSINPIYWWNDNMLCVLCGGINFEQIANSTNADRILIKCSRIMIWIIIISALDIQFIQDTFQYTFNWIKSTSEKWNIIRFVHNSHFRANSIIIYCIQTSISILPSCTVAQISFSTLKKNDITTKKYFSVARCGSEKWKGPWPLPHIYRLLSRNMHCNVSYGAAHVSDGIVICYILNSYSYFYI